MFMLGQSRFKVTTSMVLEHSNGLYSKTDIILDHIQELDERWRTFDERLRTRIYEIQGFWDCYLPKFRKRIPTPSELLVKIIDELHKRNVLSIRKDRSARTWYPTFTGIAGSVLNSIDPFGTINDKSVIITFSAFVKLNSKVGWIESSYGFARMFMRVYVINFIGHVLENIRISRNLEDRLSTVFIDFGNIDDVEFDCVHDVTISCPKTDRVLFETAVGAGLPELEQLTKHDIRTNAWVDYGMHNIPKEVYDTFEMKNTKIIVDRLSFRYQKEDCRCQILFEGRSFYNIVIGKVNYIECTRFNVNPQGPKPQLGVYQVLEKIDFNNYAYLSSYRIENYELKSHWGVFHADREIHDELMRGNDSRHSIEGYRRYLCIKDKDRKYTWYVV
jgi:hypothetical protein